SPHARCRALPPGRGACTLSAQTLCRSLCARMSIMLNSHGRASRQPCRFPAKRSQMERRPVPFRDRSVLHTLVVDSLAEQIAILDRAANIVDVNAAWRRFALENGLAPELLAAGRSYLELLAATSPADSRHGKYA